MVTAGFCSLPGGYWWLLLVTGGHCLLPLVTARSHFKYERLCHCFLGLRLCLTEFYILRFLAAERHYFEESIPLIQNCITRLALINTQ